MIADFALEGIPGNAGRKFKDLGIREKFNDEIDENRESSGAFTPNDMVIATAKRAKSAALAKVTGRQNMPRMRVIFNSASATVAMMASAGARAVGKKLFTLAV